MRKGESLHPGKAWQRWCEEHADELPLPIRGFRTRKRITQLYFHGAHPSLRFVAYRTGISTKVWLRDYCYDMLVDLDAAPLRDQDGRWYCNFCGKDERYGSLHEIFVQDIFVPWMKHINALLQPNVWVAGSGIPPSGSSWAEFHSLPMLPEWIGDNRYTYFFRACVDPHMGKPSVSRNDSRT
jgi:hypothetical protein